MKNILKYFSIFPLLILTFPLSTWGALQVFPTRLFLGNAQRVGQLKLRHIGPKAETYKITTVFYRMNKIGALETILDPMPEERPLIKYLKFSPRSVTLPPNIEQTVKVMVVMNDVLPEGDYRAHIHFEPLGEPDASEQESDDSKVAMKLSAKVAVAIPVFFTQGNPTHSSTISNLKLITLADGKPGFDAKIVNSGQKFLYGDIKVSFTPKGKSPVQVGIVSGVSSYVPERTVQFPLSTLPSDLSLKNGNLKATLTETTELNSKLLSYTEIEIP